MPPNEAVEKLADAFSRCKCPHFGPREFAALTGFDLWRARNCDPRKRHEFFYSLNDFIERARSPRRSSAQFWGAARGRVRNVKEVKNVASVSARDAAQISDSVAPYPQREQGYLACSSLRRRRSQFGPN
jgi:hypothetical protein